jgi:hypothetical protein
VAENVAAVKLAPRDERANHDPKHPTLAEPIDPAKNRRPLPMRHKARQHNFSWNHGFHGWARIKSFHKATEVQGANSGWI